VFFDGARAKAIDVVGGVNNGWKVAMGTLAFERGASTLGQQLATSATSSTPSWPWPGPTAASTTP
jgi:alkylation response protein AidB-like acyl-CoA dehydrogenase